MCACESPRSFQVYLCEGTYGSERKRSPAQRRAQGRERAAADVPAAPHSRRVRRPRRGARRCRARALTGNAVTWRHDRCGGSTRLDPLAVYGVDRGRHREPARSTGSTGQLHCGILGRSLGGEKKRRAGQQTPLCSLPRAPPGRADARAPPSSAMWVKGGRVKHHMATLGVRKGEAARAEPPFSLTKTSPAPEWST